METTACEIHTQVRTMGFIHLVFIITLWKCGTAMSLLHKRWDSTFLHDWHSCSNFKTTIAEKALNGKQDVQVFPMQANHGGLACSCCRHAGPPLQFRLPPRKSHGILHILVKINCGWAEMLMVFYEGWIDPGPLDCRNVKVAACMVPMGLLFGEHMDPGHQLMC